MVEQRRTYQSRLRVSAEEDIVLSGYGCLFGKAERTLFAKLQGGENLAALKREFLPKFGITARQFNGMAAELADKITSIRERQTGLIKDGEQRIARAKKVLRKIADPAKCHKKQCRIDRLKEQLIKLKEDHKAGKVHLCFGSKKLFRSQFHLKENGYASHDEWKRDWQAARDGQFFVIGSKDETAGCQSCVATVQCDGSITLRLPDVITEHGKYLTFRGIWFPYGHEALVAAIGRNLSSNKQDWQAINYRFLKDDKGWRVFVTVSMPEVPIKSRKDTGVIGIDFNADHLAVTETDRFGNPVEYFRVACVTYGKTAEQRRAVIGEAVKVVIAFAVKKGKPIVIEKLDFRRKKAALEEQNPRYARMLSALAYTQIQTITRARAFDAGIRVFEVNPAYSSGIGQYKFASRYGMSGHTAAIREKSWQACVEQVGSGFPEDPSSACSAQAVGSFPILPGT